MKLVSLKDVLPEGQTTLKGFDASNYVYPEAAKAMWDKGYRVVMRYLRLWDLVTLDKPDGQGGSDSLSRQELDELLAAGWLVGIQQFGCTSEKRLPMTAVEGAKRGTIMARNALALGFPEGMPVFCDLEWSTTSPGRGVRAAHFHNAWHDSVVDLGLDSGLYNGGNLGASSRGLYCMFKTRRYWQSAVQGEPEPATRGPQIRQSAPQRIWTGRRYFEFDANVFQADLLGDYPVFTVAT